MRHSSPAQIRKANIKQQPKFKNFYEVKSYDPASKQFCPTYWPITKLTTITSVLDYCHSLLTSISNSRFTLPAYYSHCNEIDPYIFE